MINKITEIMKDLEIAPTFTVRDELFIRFDVKMTVEEVRDFMLKNATDLNVVYFAEPDVFLYKERT